MNLYDETIRILYEHGKNFNDVKWIGFVNQEYAYPDKDFKSYELIGNPIDFMNFEYNNGFGCTEININLVVVGKNWWLERHDYDGSEWWEYKEIPLCPIMRKIGEESILKNEYDNR